jgi:2-C-methyl-D-erythritol 4-phosphate cytidylyltransferase
MKKYALIVAAGSGLRMGSGIPKQFLLLKGKPVLMHTLEAFYHYDPEIQIITLLAPGQREYWHDLCQKHDFQIRHLVVDGGENRFHSVKNGLAHVSDNALVAVHDGVRPIIDRELLDTLFLAAEKEEAVYPAVPVIDTLRRRMDNEGYITMDRSEFCLVQTPQVFSSCLLLRAYQTEYSERYTDDISVVESQQLCSPVMVPGKRENIKITTPIDLIIAEAILNQ